jgi:hypothetical protein
MKTILLLLAVMGSFLATAQKNNYDSKGKQKVYGEKTYLQITKASHPKSMGGGVAAFAALAAPAIDAFITIGKEIRKANVKKYEGSYKASNYESGFYEDSTSVFLPKLTITRDILLKTGTEINAATITLTPELSADRSSFRYKLTDLTYLYSIAKTKGDWDYINVNVELKFKALAINKGQYELKDLRGTNLFIPMVLVGSTYTINPNKPIYSGWIPFPPPVITEKTLSPETTESQEVTTATEKAGTTTTEKATNTTKTKKAVKGEEADMKNTGTYEIECTVVETNPYKITVEYRQQLAEASGDKVGELLKAAAGLLKKDEE